MLPSQLMPCNLYKPCVHTHTHTLSCLWAHSTVPGCLLSMRNHIKHSKARHNNYVQRAMILTSLDRVQVIVMTPYQEYNQNEETFKCFICTIIIAFNIIYYVKQIH